MKKLIAILFVAVMCLSLVACGGGDESVEHKVIGKWKTPDDYYNQYELVINDDHTGTLTYDEKTESFTWVFDEHTRTLILTSEDSTRDLTYLEVNDTFTAAGTRFQRAE